MTKKKLFSKLSAEFKRLELLQDAALKLEESCPILRKSAEHGSSLEGLLNDAASSIDEAIVLLTKSGFK